MRLQLINSLIGDNLPSLDAESVSWHDLWIAEAAVIEQAITLPPIFRTSKWTIRLPITIHPGHRRLL
jgi:hypothetical protein